MASRMLMVGGVAVGCLTAAGLGGYVAVRSATPAAAIPTAEAMVDTIDVGSPAQHRLAPVAIEPVELEATSVDRVPAAPVAAAAPVPRHPGRVTSPAATEAAPPRREPSRPNQPARHRTEAASADATRDVPDVAAPAPEPAPVLAATAASATMLPVYPRSTARLPEPRVEVFEIASNAVIGIRLDTTVSSETAAIEDDVRAVVSRPVLVDGVTVIPTGAQLQGSVTHVERGGKIRERSRIGIRFTSIVLDNGQRVPISTETIFREGEAPAGEATARIGASAVIGSILGGVFGGKKGAAIGGAAGAAGGTAIVVAGDRNEAAMSSGTALTVRLSEAVAVQVER